MWEKNVLSTHSNKLGQIYVQWDAKLKFKIGLSLFSCVEKYTEQRTHCAVWMHRWVFKWSTRPNDLLNSLLFTFTVYHILIILPHMLFETTRFCTCVITFCALVSLFSSVNADVPLQSSCSLEWAPVLFTVIWLLSTVGDKMLGKIFFCDWRKFAPIALIWLFREVRFDVISKMTCLCSCIITLCALVWLFPTLA